MVDRGQDNFLSLGWETILEDGWTTSWSNSMEMWKGKGNTTKLLFSLKGLEILHQVKREQVKPFNRIPFYKAC